MKKLYLPVLAVLALASCSKSELAVRPDNGQVEIKATSQALTIDTRAPFEGQIGGGNNLTAYVIMSQTSGDYTSLYGTEGTMTFTDDNTTAVSFDVTPQYYPADNSPIYLAALYPETGWTNIGTTASFNVDGKSDLMAAAEETSTKSDALDGTVPSFTFKHLLTKLTVEVKAENQAAIDAWGAITAMTAEKGDDAKFGMTAVVTLANGTAATGTGFSSNVNNLPFYTITDGTTYTDDAVDGTHTITLTEAPVLAAYSLVPPINAQEGTTNFQLSVTTEKSGKAISVPVDVTATAGGTFTGDTQGKAFKITITFKATEIQAKATVIAWEDAGSSNVEIQ